MLLNIVRSRYLEVPVFITLGSVLTQYEYDRSIGLGGIFETGGGSNDFIITSKRALRLIIVLFRLQAPTPSGAAPILTLPTG